MWYRFKNWIKSIFKKKEVVIDVVVSNPRIDVNRAPTYIDYVLPEGDFGVDISHHNKNVDMDLLCENVDFIYMKATEGNNFVSSAYHKRAKELYEKVTPWGAYHYYKVRHDPITQAIHFTNHLYDGCGLPPVLDIEGIGNTFRSPGHTKDLLKFLEYVENKTGVVPIIYTGYYFARDQIKPTEAFAKYPLWIAWYTPYFAKVKTPKPWEQIKIWQYTETGRVKGVIGDVDKNRVMS